MTSRILGLAIAVAALGATTAYAAPPAGVPQGPPDHANGPPEHAKGPPAEVPQGPPADTPDGEGQENSPKGNAYGRACAGESKKHVKGERGTAFSRCVTALAKLGKGEARSPRSACKELSRKPDGAEGGGSPFSRCVRAAAKLRREQQA